MSWLSLASGAMGAMGGGGGGGKNYAPQLPAQQPLNLGNIDATQGVTLNQGNLNPVDQALPATQPVQTNSQSLLARLLNPTPGQRQAAARAGNAAQSDAMQRLAQLLQGGI